MPARRYAKTLVITLVTVVMGGLVAVPASGNEPRGPAWQACTDPQLAALRMECASLETAMDHANPDGRTISLALVRKEATGTPAEYQGTLLVSAGGPGAKNRLFAAIVANQVPPEVSAGYDIVGFDPRGVGASRPAIRCDRSHFAPVRPDPVPANLYEEWKIIKDKISYVLSCVRKNGSMLPYMSTEDLAGDVDAIRAAIGDDKVSFLGYAYGSYLGAVYASLYPDNVRRLVLDSVFRPSGNWYRHGRDHGAALGERAQDFFGWVADHDEVYSLGGDAAQVEQHYYSMRSRLESDPAAGLVGPRELDATFLNAGYLNVVWPRLASAMSAYVHGDGMPLVAAYKQLGAHLDDNDYAAHSATQCSDTSWPRSWRRWHRDAERDYREHPFMTWLNVWYNAPCAFWPVRTSSQPSIPGGYTGSALLVQGTRNAAAPLSGARQMHQAIADSRLVRIDGGMNNLVTFFGGNTCVDSVVADYLVDGGRPAQTPGADHSCAPIPAPSPDGPGRIRTSGTTQATLARLSAAGVY